MIIFVLTDLCNIFKCMKNYVNLFLRMYVPEHGHLRLKHVGFDNYLLIENLIHLMVDLL
jgi:hypothetical protein